MSNYSGKKNAAYVGQHVTPEGGRAFVVYYLGHAELAAVNAARRAAGLRVYPRGHRHRLKAGWYWISLKDQADMTRVSGVGPFTASGETFRAAIDTLDKGRN